MNTVIRINLSNRSANSEQVPAEYNLLGGRALTSTVVSQEVPPECEALGERNKLIIAPARRGLRTTLRVRTSKEYEKRL